MSSVEGVLSRASDSSVGQTFAAAEDGLPMARRATFLAHSPGRRIHMMNITSTIELRSIRVFRAIPKRIEIARNEGDPLSGPIRSALLR